MNTLWQWKFNIINFDKTKTKIQKDQNLSEGNHGWKTGMTKVHVIAYFQNFHHFLWMNATSYYWLYIDFYTLITYTSYITYTYNCTPCIDYFIIQFSVPIPRHKSHLSHVNVFLRHYTGQLKTAVEQVSGEKIAWKR